MTEPPIEMRCTPLNKKRFKGGRISRVSNFGGARMAVPRKAISQKNFIGHCSGLIFEGLRFESPGRISRSDKAKSFSNPQRSVRRQGTLWIPPRGEWPSLAIA
jgi:hypothetical protein